MGIPLGLRIMLRGILLCLCLASFGKAKSEKSAPVVWITPKNMNEVISGKWLVLFTFASRKRSIIMKKFINAANDPKNAWLENGWKLGIACNKKYPELKNKFGVMQFPTILKFTRKNSKIIQRYNKLHGRNCDAVGIV